MSCGQILNTSFEANNVITAQNLDILLTQKTTAISTTENMYADHKYSIGAR